MWSGVMLNIKTGHLIQYKAKKRTSNNPVENHFDFVKNDSLHKKLQVKTSEFVAPSYRFLLSKYVLHYLNDSSKQRKFKKQITDEIEKWKDKKEYNRIKGFYFQNIANFHSNIQFNSTTTFDKDGIALNDIALNDIALITASDKDNHLLSKFKFLH